MGKKKRFIDKKNSATFQLLPRDSSAADAAADASDRVFVRVDNNAYLPPLHYDQDADDSIFADAPGDSDDDRPAPWIATHAAPGALPEHVRREILELGLPDDGYNYLLHMREISGAGAGSAFYHNPKARLDDLPLDVKAFDASRLRISAEVRGESRHSSGDLMQTVASRTVGVKVRKALDTDVLRLLDDDDMSRFGSDVEDLEEDFVVQANQPENGEVEDEVLVFGAQQKKADARGNVGLLKKYSLKDQEEEVDVEEEEEEETEVGGGENLRVPRLLDEQFDLLTLREYDDDSDDVGYVDDEGESLAVKLNDALKEYAMDDLELQDNYRVPGDFIHCNQGSSSGAQLDVSVDVIRRCAEYAEMYENEDADDEEVVLVQESSEESEVWDCETIVSTYSNLDNHPAKIEAPGNSKKRVQKNMPADSAIKNNVIALRGKEKLPVDFLPQTRKAVEKVKKAEVSGGDQQKRRPHCNESKEEKKERKAAVKEERREARRSKKELKSLYRCETQRAQKVAAFSGPSSVHIM